MKRERRERWERREKNQTEEEVVSLPAKGQGWIMIFFSIVVQSRPHHQNYFTANYFHPS